MDLKFDRMAVNTNLAQDYMKNNSKLNELYKNYNTITYQMKNYTFDGEQFKESSDDPNFESSEIDKNKLLGFAQLLKENAVLISQIENYFRRIPVEDTNVQLNLIIQILKSITPKKGPKNYSAVHIFNPDSPLLTFGRLLDIVWYPRHSLSLACTSSAAAAICHLFVKLCNEVGLNIKVVFHPETSMCLKSQPKLSSGTVAVVTEDADVDSAVDKFLSGSLKTPWRLRRILVQESVYQQFRDALRWKSNLKNGEDKSQKPSALCSETLITDSMIFQIDSVEPTQNSPAVRVEAYRTTKELISLVQKDDPCYLSLWSNNIAEINEVSYSVKAPIVWVNNLADFRGPPQIVEAFFPIIFYVFQPNMRIMKCDKISKLCELSRSWQNIDFERRREILCEVLDKYILNDPSESHYKEIRDSLSDCTKKSFVDVGKDYVCVGTTIPVGIRTFSIYNKFFSVNDQFFTVANFESLLQGNAFVVYGQRHLGYRLPELEILEQAQVPVVNVDELVNGDFVISNQFTPDTQTRVIWTNSGTIFAN